MDPFAEAVEWQIEANEDNDGWSQGPQKICAEMAEEAVDVCAWGRGLEEYPLTPEQSHRLDHVREKARDLWQEIEALKATY